MRRFRGWVPVFAGIALALFINTFIARVGFADDVRASDGSRNWIQIQLNRASEYKDAAFVFLNEKIKDMKASWKRFRKSDTGKKIMRGVGEAGTMVREIKERVNIAPLKENQAVIRLKNGSAISCEIVSEDSKQIVARWEGGEITFSRGEIASIERKSKIVEGDGIFIAEKAAVENDWPYKANPVVRLKNGQTLDGTIEKVGPETIFIKEGLGGGSSIDHDVGRDRIETLIFRPVRNAESSKIEDRLRGHFPKMRFYRDGMLTLLTDSEGSSLKILRKVLQDQATAVYLEFFELFKGRRPGLQHYVVVFDDVDDYFEYAVTDGVPAWMCPGYFTPVDKTLYMMNLFGDKFTTFMYDVVKMSRQAIDRGVDVVRGAVGGRYETQLDGVAHDLKVRYENMAAYLRNLAMEETLLVLRHELTHEFMHDWGVQGIIVSKVKENEKLKEMKKKFLEVKDIDEKKKLIVKILGLQKRESNEELSIDAANSWFIEGTAEYASTSAIGMPNKSRLYGIKEARKNNALLPLEHLTVYKMGSFLGLASEAALSVYAQSWSLVDFLMARHRSSFIKYLDRMSREKPGENDDLNWLLQATQTELRALENEWHAHIDSLPETEDPQIEQWMRVREILGIQ